MPSPYCVVVPRKPLSAKQKAGRTLGSQNAERGRLTKRFFLELWDQLPRHIRLRGVRADAGFCLPDLLALWERLGVPYVVVAQLSQ